MTDEPQVTKANKENHILSCELNKNIQNLYEENHKLILEVTIDDLNTWKTYDFGLEDSIL